MIGRVAAGAVAAALVAAPVLAQPDDLEQALRTTPITVQRVSDRFFVLYGVGGNMAVSIGESGVLTVDTQYAAMAEKYLGTIRELGGDGVDFAINSHWHLDHSGGNLVLGPAGTWIVAQTDSRERLREDNTINLVSRTQEMTAYPVAAQPSITFTEQMSFEFNGEHIELLHFGPAHTAGDTAIIFREHNAVHMGDVFNNNGYPFIDVDNGGDFEGLIDFCRAVLNLIDPETLVIPGHGAVADYVELADYTSMLSQIRDRVRELIEDGATLEQVIAARPTRRWDGEQGDPANFLNRVYASLTR